ncbi:MAG: protease pro-enzyme activation domain-containing protein [Candidatus Sulfotelmatobacter sp.]
MQSFSTRHWKFFLLPFLVSSLCFAEQPDRIAGTIDSSQMVALVGQIQKRAKPKYDQGRLSGSFHLNQVTLLTLPTQAQQQALRLLVAEQQDPKSPNFHKWITPEQYADRFGLSPNDVKNISAWLQSQGLTVVSVARGRNWIVFSGTAAQIQTAFRTEIHNYNVNGEIHFANAVVPSIPAALSGIVAGLRGLDDFHPKPMYVKKLGSSLKLRPDYYDNSYQIPDFLAPGDIATIYDIQTLYNTGVDGTGQKLVIVGQTDVYLADLNAFRTAFGLTLISGCTTNASGVITACNTSNFDYVLDGADPGVSTTGDLTEADLDLEWSAATARGAQIIFVNSTDVFTSYYYAIDNDLAPVMSMSYGAPCEFDDNQVSSDEIELTKANSEGITFMNSSGDSGAASCDGPTDSSTNNLAVNGLAVSYPASSPEITAVGGTAITYPAGFDSTYWSTTNGALPNGGTAQNAPLPETSWNDDVEIGTAYNGGSPLSVQEGYAIVSSGGGASNCSVQNSDFSSCVSGFPQPSWQTVTVPGQPDPTTRLVPDVSLLASPNFPGYIYCTPVDQLSDTAPYDTETTSSCGTGTAADIVTSVNGIGCSQTTGLCTVDPALVGGTSASSPIFAGIVTLLNQYLGSNGLGNINQTLYSLAETPSNGAFHQITSGSNVVYCEGSQPTYQPADLRCPGASGTTGSFGYQASSADSTTGYNLVTGLGSVDANALFTAWNGSATAPDFTFVTTTNLTPTSVPAGQAATATLTVTPVNGSTQSFSFTSSSCSGLPTGATCSFSPATFSLDGTDAQTVQLTITTAANMALPSGAETITVTGKASGSGSTSHTTTVSLTVTATNQSFTITPASATYLVNVGGTDSVVLTVAGANGFVSGTGSGAATALAIQYTCTGQPSTINCNPGTNPYTTSINPTVSIVTQGVTAQLKHPGGNRMLYALLLPGLFGVVFLAGSRRRGVRMLSVIIVLGFSTMWLGSCGSSGGNSQSNSGTPPGKYTITITGSTSGSVPLTASTTITLTVSAP